MTLTARGGDSETGKVQNSIRGSTTFCVATPLSSCRPGLPCRSGKPETTGEPGGGKLSVGTACFYRGRWSVKMRRRSHIKLDGCLATAMVERVLVGSP